MRNNRMRAWLKASIALPAGLLLASQAGAVALVLSGTSANGSNTTFTYGGSFAVDPSNPGGDPIEGLVTGSRLIIYDFKGYVAGSVFSPYANVLATSQLVSDATLLPPATTDDPTIANLVFTYTGPDVTPPAGFAFTGFSADSIFSLVDPAGSAFGTQTLKVTNNTPFYVQGFVAAPGAGAVPEPASWAMMLGGFGMIGGALRAQRRRTKVKFA
ncbi:PEPxxWA-CTERM sorting domain-containing protein [Sphingomonas sp. MMS24-J13]|uniref:PEPxxWA-CTERM sorting domain-containing protein n=1 Tax=Sphingomonas sp. MMS24-J13 TaxID=3238686 RepID=UPI00384C47CB